MKINNILCFIYFLKNVPLKNLLQKILHFSRFKIFSGLCFLQTKPHFLNYLNTV